MARLELKGAPVSPGIGIGSALVIVEAGTMDIPKRSLEGKEVEPALDRFESARNRAIQGLQSIQEVTAKELGIQDAAIYGAQVAVLQDPDALKQVRNLISKERLEPESAIRDLLEGLSRIFEKMEGGDIKNWAADLRDPWFAVVRELRQEVENRATLDGSKALILVAEELLPSLATRFPRNLIAGIACSRGGRYSHGAVVARSFGIPTVTGVERLLSHASTGESCVVEGETGVLRLGVDDAEREASRTLAEEREKVAGRLAETSTRPGATACGHPISMTANIETPRDLDSFNPAMVGGVGLFRTEFAYMERSGFPTLEEQRSVYKEIVDHFEGKPVVFRTLDVGNDKRLRYFDMPPEQNPALGWRGIRMSLEWQDLFLIQIQAIVAAHDEGEVRILLPMLTVVEELREAKALMEKALGSDAQRVLVGAMIEVPAAAMALKDIAQEADFVSVGTNDLTQYLFAVDRDNTRVSSLYQPYHPANLRVLRFIAKTCRQFDCPVSVCGEMAGQRAGALFLAGSGYQALSMGVGFVPEIKALLAQTTLKDLVALSRQAAGCRTREEAVSLLREAAAAAWEGVLANS